jgi:hypothetical protein
MKMIVMNNKTINMVARKKLVQDIGSTFDILVKEISKFSGESINKVPFDGSWTAGQVTEHIMICGRGIPDNKTTEADRPYDENVAAIKALFLNYDMKFKTDASIAPGPPLHDREALLQNIKEIKERLETVAKTTDLEALCKDMELPTFGYLTRYEWLRFILFHTERHVHQIRNIYAKIMEGPIL